MPRFTKRKPASMQVQETVAVYASSPMEFLPAKSIDHRAEGQRRDTAIIALVHRHGVITSDLVQLAIAREQFELPGESRATILNRLTALSAHGYVHRLGRSRTGHIVYATHKRRKGAQPQIEHDLIGARFGVHLDLSLAECGMEITDLVSDQVELRLLACKEEWQFVPDRIFTLQNVRYFCEWDNSTEGDNKILVKIQAYKKYVRGQRQRREMLEKLGEKVNNLMRVLWVATTEKRAEKLAEMLKGNLHWLTYEKAYLGKPEMVLSPIWVVGKTDEKNRHRSQQAKSS